MRAGFAAAQLANVRGVIRKETFMKYISILVVFLLTGCATTFFGLSKTTSVSSDENYEVVAKNIYQAAKNCWEKEPSGLLLGTVVKSEITLDGIVIRVGYSSTMEYTGQLTIQFIVQEDGNGSIVDLYERNISYLGKKEFDVAHDWLQGNYACTPQNV